MGEGKQIGTLLSAPALTMVRLAWVKLLLFAVPQLQTEKALILNEGGIYGCRTVHRVVLRAQGTPTHCNASDARVGVIWQGSAPLQPKCKTRMGGPKGMWSSPLQQQSVSSQHSLSGPKPKLTQVKAVNRKGQKGITTILFLNPDPVAHLVGHANEVPVVIDGHEVTALIDLGAQVSNISVQLCKDLDLKIQPLGQLLE